jgi:hypothetical protein
MNLVQQSIRHRILTNWPQNRVYQTAFDNLAGVVSTKVTRLDLASNKEG